MPKNARACVAIFFFFWACSHSGTVSTSSNGSVQVKGDGVSVDINSGKPITNYPGDAPLYTGKPVMDVVEAPKHSRQVVVQTPDSLEKISDFYKSELANRGWKLQTNMNTDQMVMYTARKEEKTMVVSISSDGSKRSITQTLTDK